LKIIMYGWKGKILRVNLSSEKITTEPLSENIAEAFIGGKGLGAYILYSELKPNIDPLGPENKLIFATGPLTGTIMPGSAKYAVMALSPLTKILGEAYSGGFFGPELKFAGYDAIVVEGKAESPVYIWIYNDDVEIRDASNIWGKDVAETVNEVRLITDKKARVACIGTAGEKLVKIACIMNDIINAAGRCGLGAVMGSKKLKAVAVRGTQKIQLYDEKKFREFAKKAYEEAWAGWGVFLNKYGTAGVLEPLNETGRLPTKNFKMSTFEGASNISGEAMTKTILIGRKACFACRNACKREVSASTPYVVDPTYGGPEYETIAALGSLCMNDNLVAIAKLNELCNRFGIDTISTGVAIAFAMECYESGLLTKEDADGLDLTWGNHEIMIRLTEKIGNKEGIGKLLGEGVRSASEKIGEKAKKYAMHVKGLEIPMHEPRGKKGVGLSYATSSRGACHNQCPHDDWWDETVTAPEIGMDSMLKRDRLYMGPEKARSVIIGQNWFSFLDSAVLCYFTCFPVGTKLQTLVNLFSTVTGLEVVAQDLTHIGERVFNLCRLFNIREGIAKKDDFLPERFTQPLTSGPYIGEAIPVPSFEKMLSWYYKFRGWDENGIPTKEKIKELKLEFVYEKFSDL
jgi:aldehyde:ferredoxin oxidoreductase